MSQRGLAAGSVGHLAEHQGAGDGAEARPHQHGGGLAVGEVPLGPQHGDQVADDEEVEIISAIGAQWRVVIRPAS